MPSSVRERKHDEEGVYPPRRVFLHFRRDGEGLHPPRRVLLHFKRDGEGLHPPRHVFTTTTTHTNLLPPQHTPADVTRKEGRDGKRGRT